MQLDRLRSRLAHLRNDLPRVYLITLTNHDCTIMGIGTEKCVIVLKDQQQAIAPQTGACINDLAIGSRTHRAAVNSRDIYAVLILS